MYVCGEVGNSNEETASINELSGLALWRLNPRPIRPGGGSSLGVLGSWTLSESVSNEEDPNAGTK